MQRYAVRTALRRTPGATPELRAAIRASKHVLTADSSDYEELVRHLLKATTTPPSEVLVRSFLALLHSQLRKGGALVMWDLPPAGQHYEPPRPPAAISCRTQDLKRLSSLVAAETDVVVCGPPGIGKTTLLEALHHQHPDAVFLRLEQGGTPIRDIRLAMHRRAGGEFPLDDDQGIALVAKTYSHGGIVLIDNADGAESEAAIRRVASHVPNVTFVVTSRGQPFPGFERLELEPLLVEAAEEVLTEFNVDPSRHAEIMSRAEGNPLILRQEAFAAAHGHDSDSDDRLGSMLERFPEAERDTLLLIGEMHAATIQLGLLMEVGHLTPGSLEILKRNAVAKPVKDAYEFHQTLRSACRGLLITASRDHLATLRLEAADYYATWLTEHPTLESIDRELPSMLQLLDTASDATHVVTLALALIGDRRDDPVGYIPSRGLAGLLREKRTALQDAARDVGGLPAAKLEKNLGLFCHWGDEPVARELVLSARSRFRSLHELEGLAAATWVLGIIADDTCQYGEAQHFYLQPLEFLSDPATRAFAHHLAACSLYHQGRYAEAKETFLHAGLDADDPALVARIERRLAYVELMSGDTSAALRALAESRTQAEAMNRPRDVARLTRHLAQGHTLLGDHPAATREFAAAREAFERLGDKRGLGACLLGEAGLHRINAKVDDAAVLVQQSREIAAGGPADALAPAVSPIGIARAEEEAGAIATLTGDSTSAIKHLRHACNIYEAIDHRSAPELAKKLGANRDAKIPPAAGVIFDLVDTLAETEQTAYEDAKLRLSATLGVEHEHFKAAWTRSRRRASTDVSWTPRDRIRWVAQQLGITVDEETLDELAAGEEDLWSASVRAKPGAVQALTTLSERGIRTALVSNGSSAMRALPDQLGLRRYLTAAVLSCEVGALKPDPGIYAAALHAIELPASSCIYVGDGSDRELEGAQLHGIFAVRVRTPDKPHYRGENSLNWDASIDSVEELLTALGA